MSNVYAIQHPHGFFKVGMSERPLNRYENLRIGSPYKTVLHTVMSTNGDARELEKKMHEELSEYHWRGEWFNVPEATLVDAFQACVDNDDTDAYHVQQIQYVKDSKPRERIERSKDAEFTKAGDYE